VRENGVLGCLEVCALMEKKRRIGRLRKEERGWLGVSKGMLNIDDVGRRMCDDIDDKTEDRMIL